MFTEKDKKHVLRYFKLLDPKISVSFDVLKRHWDMTRACIRIEWQTEGVEYGAQHEFYPEYLRDRPGFLRMVCGELTAYYLLALHKHVGWEEDKSQ